MSNPTMCLPATFRSIVALAVVMLAGCATVATDVTILDQAQKFAPTENVVILLDFPAQPFVKVALVEARGTPGGGEAVLFEEARKRAREVGADALVRVEVYSVYQPPVRVYEPAYGYPFYSPFGIRTGRITTGPTAPRFIRTTATGGWAAATCKS